MLDSFTLQLPMGAEWIWISFIVIILIIIGIIFVIRAILKKIPTARSKRLDVLKDRLARGEITKEEFDRLKKELE